MVDCNTTVLGTGSSWPPQIQSATGVEGKGKKIQIIKHKRLDFRRCCALTAFLHIRKSVPGVGLFCANNITGQLFLIHWVIPPFFSCNPKVLLGWKVSVDSLNLSFLSMSSLSPVSEEAEAGCEEEILHLKGWALEQTPQGNGHSTKPDKSSRSIWIMLSGMWGDSWGVPCRVRSGA